MDDNLYNEFGNYIRSELESDSDDEKSVYGQDNRHAEEVAMEEDEDAGAEPEEASLSVVLHEDKRYYPQAVKVYGPDIEILVQEKKIQALDKPLVEPVKHKKFQVQEQKLSEKHSAEAVYTRRFHEYYETAQSRALEYIKCGRTSSRLQALVTACKLMQAEGKHAIEGFRGYYFPSIRLKNIFLVLLDSEISMSAPITRFQKFTEYRDVQQYGLKVLSTLTHPKSPTPIYMQNYLELLDKLLVCEIPTEVKNKAKEVEEKEEKLLCATEEKAPFPYNPSVCRRYANRCWGFACQWPLCEEPRTQRRALLLLIERLMPLLTRVHLATDMLFDGLDAGGPISMLALQGVLELVRRHNIEYPDMYDRLYAMFEPEMFATRYKRRLLHLADVFLSSTHLPEGLVAAFVKRLSRLALVASAEDAAALLQLVANLLLRHPALKRMICYDDAPAIMSGDPYVMEETCARSSRALGSSLWEVAALRRHFAPALAAAAARVMAAAHARDQPVSLAPPDQAASFDTELKRRFKTIEMNFVRTHGITAPSDERLLHYWELMA